MYPKYTTPVTFAYVVNLRVLLWIVSQFLKSSDNPIEVVIGLLQAECYYSVLI